jgi:hypothetical protein
LAVIQDLFAKVVVSALFDQLCGNIGRRNAGDGDDRDKRIDPANASQATQAISLAEMIIKDHEVDAASHEKQKCVFLTGRSLDGEFVLLKLSKGPSDQRLLDSIIVNVKQPDGRRGHGRPLRMGKMRLTRIGQSI